MNTLMRVILLVTLTGFARSAAARPAEDALGAFTSQTNVLPGTTRACFLEDRDVALLLRPGRDIRMISLSDPGDSVVVAEGDFTAITALEDGTWLAFDAESGSIVQRDLPSGSVSGSLDLRRSEPLKEGVDPFVDVVALEPHPDGILVVERSAHRVRVIGWDGTEHLRLGGKGSAEGAFSFPADAAVDATGGIYVVDRDNHRVQRFAPDGAFVQSWGGRGAFPGLLSAPSSIDIEGGLIYVAEELNHRVSVFEPTGRFLYQWGMHPLVPRKGEGAIHYPMSIDVAPDGSEALVAEPFERRVQRFSVFPGGVEEARSQPMPSKQSILSHFGPFLAADDDLLAMWEPESGAITVFDMSDETGINITVFSNHGSGWDDMGRLGAVHIDGAPQECIVSDVVNDRLMRWRLRRDRDGVRKYDPFMARLATAVDLDRTRRRLETLEPDRDWAVPRIEALARARSEGAPLLAADVANGVVIALDDRLDPIAVATDCTDPVAMIGDTDRVLLVEADGAILAIEEAGVRTLRSGSDDPIAEPIGGATLVRDATGSGTVFLSLPESDRIVGFDIDGPEPGEQPDAEWGGVGDADGRFHAPSGLGVIRGNRIVVVDQGNHRAQIFTPEGGWLSTFSLSSGYTTPRRRAAEDPETGRDLDDDQ